MFRRRKRGFTLAELLIVVAIIAVLVAIAVPLFVGSLNDAEKRTFEANQHAVKSAAVAYILENENDIDISDVEGGTKLIQATGTFTEQGDFTKVAVTVVDKASIKKTSFDEWKKSKTELSVEVDLTSVKKA